MALDGYKLIICKFGLALALVPALVRGYCISQLNWIHFKVPNAQMSKASVHFVPVNQLWLVILVNVSTVLVKYLPGLNDNVQYKMGMGRPEMAVTKKRA